MNGAGFGEEQARLGASQGVDGLVVTMETLPRALNEGLPAPVAREGERLVGPWVESNRQALLHFWREGTSWGVDEVRAFVTGLCRMG